MAGVDLGHAIRVAVARGLLVKGGGHALAAGLTIEEGRLGELRAYLEEALGRSVHGSTELEGLPIDAALSARGATIEMIDQIARAGPFGTAHPEPIFVLPSHRIAFAETVGNGHIRLTLASSDGATIKAMAFRAADAPLGQALLANRGQFLHAAGMLTIDQWQGRRQPVFRVIDAAVPVV
jgi:single-stranded-DNA-specific exonuclease